MPDHVCPFWVGYLLLSPLRKLLEHPDKLLGPFVRPGMTVLEPGCAMGFFTLPLARMVGSEGRVVAVEIQKKMIQKLEKRAGKAGLLDRIEIRQAGNDNLDVKDLSGQVDFSAAIHVVHEVPNQASFFSDIITALKPGGRFFVVEPKGHVSRGNFEQTMAVAEKIGFQIDEPSGKKGAREALLVKPHYL